MSTSFGKDPQNPRDGTGWGIKAEKQVVSGTNEGILDDVIKVVISDPTDTINQEDWFGGDSGYISDTTGLISDSGSVIIKHEVPKNGDDQYDAADDLMGRIILKVGGEGLDHEWHVKTGFLSASTEYGGRTSEDIKEEKQIDIGGDDIGIIPVLWNGGGSDYVSGDDQYDARTKEWLDGMGFGRTSEDINDPTWDIDGDFYIMDPTSWVGHTSTFSSGHTNSFSGDWGT
jgi:hypothetical protein